MAITRAQIARELYIKGGVVNPDGRRGFGGGATMGASDKGYQGGGRDKEGNVSGDAPGGATGDPGGNNNRPTSTRKKTTTTGLTGPRELGASTRTVNRIKSRPPQEIVDGRSYDVGSKKLADAKKAKEERLEKEEEERKKSVFEKLADYNRRYKEKQLERYRISKINELNSKLGQLGVDFFGDTTETYGDIINANAPSITDFGPEGTGKYSQQFIDDVLSGKRPAPESFTPIDPNALPTLTGQGIVALGNLIGPKMTGPTTREELMDLYSGGINSYTGARDFDIDTSTGKEMMKIFEPNRYARENNLVYNKTTGAFTPKPNEGDGGGDNNYIPPIIPEDDTTEEDTAVTRNLGGLSPRFAGSIFDFTGMADGGIARAGYQQGGSIMPRLNQLSGSIASAEQTLQGINQRLESVESSLGSSDGSSTMPENNNFTNPTLEAFKLDSGKLDPGKNLAVQPPVQTPNPFDLSSNTAGFIGEPLKSVEGSLAYPNLKELNKPMVPMRGGPEMMRLAGMPLRAAFADGGMMEDTPEGGIMDLESGRQMYFLGRLVKKAKRAVKKVVKSPFGKAALLYGLGAMGGSLGAGKGLFSKGMFNLANMKAGLFGQAMKPGFAGPGIPGLFNKLGLTKTAGSMMPTLGGGITLGLGVPLALDLLGVGKKEEDDFDVDEYYRTQGIDIDAIRNNPNQFLARRFMAEGGDAEPVAKETMPLLDMDGKEMDLREDGGFVPIGRMERADDVPARLSKNEFVFTADAVRNAGEGDIDKGAEVMYNMMKNLESGGEVSEESQGLDGAREMFQTSQRLEEVL